MSDPVFIIRGAPPRTISCPFASPAFVRDARAVLSIRREALEAIGEHLAAVPGFLSGARLVELLGGQVKDAELARHLASFTSNLDAMSHRTQQGLDTFIEAITRQIRQQSDFAGARGQEDVLAAEEIDELGRRIPVLMRGGPSPWAGSGNART